MHLSRPYRSFRGLSTLTTLAATALLAACSSVYRVDSQVQSFATWPQPPSDAPETARPVIPQAPQTYRFERLPSQRVTVGGVAQAQSFLEGAAARSLGRYGWQQAALGENKVPWAIEVSGNTVRLPHAPWEEPWEPWWPRVGIGIGSGRGGHVWTSVGIHSYYPYQPYQYPYYVRSVAVVIRSTTNGSVVYETQATHEGRWNDTPELWQAMFDAALTGFPVPPAGPRTVNTDLPR